MKRGMILSIALMLAAVLVSLMSSDSTVQAKKEKTFSADTGIITLGPHQVLRIVTDNKDPDAEYVVSFKQMSYRGAASGGGSRHNLVSQTTSESITVAPGEGFSIALS